MIFLSLRTEYSFKKCYGYISDIVKVCDMYEEMPAIGVADFNGTFGHVMLEQACKVAGKKPIFGVKIMVIPKKIDKKKQFGPHYTFIAMNEAGIAELYRLVKRAYDNFYYHPFITYVDLDRISPNIIVIAENFDSPQRIDYVGLSTITHKLCYQYAVGSDMPRVALQNNFYTTADDKKIYELLAGDRDRETQTYPQHILSDAEWIRMWPGESDAIQATFDIAEMIDVKLPKASMVKYSGRLTLKGLCAHGAKLKGIDVQTGEYADRLTRELAMIESKDFGDYFLIVADMVSKAKRKMLVGPSRGSSAGSLVCFLTGITEIDPIKHGLLFERFIDINRADLPDIDIDFPDVVRGDVLSELRTTYGHDHVSHIGTISKLKPKSAIGEFAMSLGVPAYETESVKDAIIERSGGDARAAMRVLDTFDTTEVGRDFISKYPKMALCEKIEGHARHRGVHAAGIIVSNLPLTNFAGVDSRDELVMADKKEAEYLGLLKIDCLGLRTLSILQSVADQISMPFKDYYKLPLEDEGVFEIFNTMRVSGIFQFEGYALQSITQQMGVHKFDDIVAITALARPGPIHSGGTNIFIERRTGEKPVTYISQHPAFLATTEPTLGVIVFQEQLMELARNYGKMTWEEVASLRRASSKSLGEEFFGKFKESFLTGTRSQDIDDTEAVAVWEHMVTFGSWGFNKSHAVGYALISYWTAWAKHNAPVEFAVAQMNNTKNPDAAIRILRDMVKNDDIKYIPVDPDTSGVEWKNVNGTLVGGLTNIKGIGIKRAREIIRKREGDRKFTPAMVRTLLSPVTPYDMLFPCRTLWGDIFDHPEKYGLENPPVDIEAIQEVGSYLFIGRLVDRNLRDLNEYQSVVKRGGKIVEHHTLFLNLTLEDDTSSIIATIDRYAYEAKGKTIAESGKVGEDWYLVRGAIAGKWRRINVREIFKLSELKI